MFDWYIGFNINGAQTMPNPNNVGASHLKNQIWHQDGGVINGTQNEATAVQSIPTISWRLVVKTPKLYHQLNDGDKIQLVIIKSSMHIQSLTVKLRVIYKEYYP